MPQKLPPPPPVDSARFNDWLQRFYKQSVGDEVAPEVESSEVSAADLNHAQLANLDSGTYSHLTSAQRSELTGTGNSTLHYHDADRARTAHTGTQSASTISDFTQAVQAIVGDSDSILAARVFGP